MRARRINTTCQLLPLKKVNELSNMVDYEPFPYDDDLFQDKTENVSDLQAYYMTQFNLELENSNKTKAKVDNLKCGVEESFDFELLGNWNGATNTDFQIDQVIDSNINEQNIKEVLLDLDSIEFDDKSFKSECKSSKNKNIANNFYESNNEYIDDESLIDELCREDGENRLSPEFNEDFQSISNEKNPLPSIETAFSKRYCNYTVENNTQFYNCNTIPSTNNTQTISSIEHFSYPNNILYNFDCGKNYILPDTPTSCAEFNFDRGDRKLSVTESIESDVQSSVYFDENSETFDEEELFVNLDDFGLTLEKDTTNVIQLEKKVENHKSQGDKVCLWEQCLQRYPNQSTLVEHIERCHVNTYKGDEFSCLWRECTRSRRPFNARYKLLIHMRVHSGHKPNRCHHPGCGKAFSRLENLKIHVRSHTGERPYACLAPHCRKAFSNSSDRAKHQRTHFNARPYACGAAGCGKRYTDPSSLRKHVKSHPHSAVPRTCTNSVPTRPARQEMEQTVPSSPARLATLQTIRDRLTLPRMHRI